MLALARFRPEHRGPTAQATSATAIFEPSGSTEISTPHINHPSKPSTKRNTPNFRSFAGVHRATVRQDVSRHVPLLRQCHHYPQSRWLSHIRQVLHRTSSCSDASWPNKQYDTCHTFTAAHLSLTFQVASSPSNPYPDVKSQKAFEKGLLEKTAKQTGDILLYDSRIVTYKTESDVMMYLVSSIDENEILLYQSLLCLRDSLHLLFK